MKISVIGLGYVGLPLSALLAQNFDVIGFDIDASRIRKLDARERVLSEPGLDEALDRAMDSGRLKFTSAPGDITDSNVKIITVGTPYDDKKKDIDYSFLDSALEAVSARVNKGDVIVLKSTVPVGTTSGRVVRALNKKNHRVPEDVGVAFSPERILEGQAIKDYKNLPKVIGASDERSYRIAEEVFSALGGRMVRVSDPQTAEMVKMIDNYARYAFLGLTNEVALISEKSGVDVMEVLKAAKDDYPRNAGLMIPGPGVGGSCLNKDPFILKTSMAREGLDLKMVDTAHEINSGMQPHVVSMVKKFARGRKRVAMAGLAFKGQTDDTRFTPAFRINALLQREGFEVRLSDPLVKSKEYAITSDIYEAATGSEILLLVTDHEAYRNIDLRHLKGLMKEKPLIIDTRAFIDRSKAEKEGFEYHGLGRL